MATPTVTVEDPHAAHGAAHHGGDGAHGGELMLVGHDGQLHPARLQHHFVSSEQQFESAKLGMWLFLATEILLFGGMFVAYGIFRMLYPELYEQASLQLDTVLGATNTIVLLLSSLTMAWAIRGAQMDNRKVLVYNLLATIALASAFLVVKYFEYSHKLEIGIKPGANFELDAGTATIGELGGATPIRPVFDGSEGAAAEGHATAVSPLAAPTVEATSNDPEAAQTEGPGEAGAAHGADHAEAHGEGHGREGEIFQNRRAGLFFAIYYMMTGIHALHILIGIIAIGILAWKATKGAYSSVWYTPVENVGLYWHIVDIIWIFVFPLMYLI